MVRLARQEDLQEVVRLYDSIHDLEEAGKVNTGWLRGIYPTESTAKAALDRGDLFVEEGEHGIVGTGIINREQVDVYAQGDWKYRAPDEEVMVLHTLVIDGRRRAQGLGHEFLQFYEDYAREHGCMYLRLDTFARNSAARAFYRAHGYDEIGIVPTVFNGIPGVDLVLIEKKLEG